MEKTFYALGLNHRTAPVATSEAFALGDAALRRVGAAFREEGATADGEEGPEAILLSTCNRTEAYLYGASADVERLRVLLSRAAGQPWPAGQDFFQKDEAAVRHVLEVACGMRSLVPGDAQILMQMKDAYRRAVEEDTVGMVGHRLMHTAFRAAKRVSDETNLGHGAASVSTAAVALAEQFFDRHASPGGLAGRRVLLVGAGKMGRLALEALRAHAPASMAVANRSPERARRAAASAGVERIAWKKRHAAAARADLVIVATGAREPILHARQLPAQLSGGDTLIIDIARPRNADPAISERPGYALRDMDALQSWVAQVEAERRAEFPRAEALCEELLGDFVSWVFHQEALQPAIHAVRSTFEEIRRQEIERHAHHFSDADAEDLERLTQSILQKLLAVPIVRLKGADPDSMDYARGVRLLRTLFSRPGCEDDPSTGEQSTAEALAGTKHSEKDDGQGDDRPVNAPARCPFETHRPEAADDRERLREALRDPSLEPSRP